jgi:hypothetical protein
LYGYCEQEERAKLVGELQSMAARAREEKASLEDKLARCLKETEVLRQQMKEMPDNRVSKMGFNPSQNRIS